METTQSNATMLKSHSADKRAVGKEGNVHGRKGEESMHHVGGGRTDSQQAKKQQEISAKGSLL